MDRLRSNDTAGAIAKFREAIRLAPDSAQAHYQLSLALRRRGALAEANAELEAAREAASEARDTVARLEEQLD